MFVGFALIASGLLLAAEHPVFFGAYGWLMFSAALIGLGTGVSVPSANNAILDVSPDDVGTLTGLRGAARQSGAIIAVALTTGLVARDAGSTTLLRGAFVGYAIVLLLLTPVIGLIPNHDGGQRAAVGEGATGSPATDRVVPFTTEASTK